MLLCQGTNDEKTDLNNTDLLPDVLCTTVDKLDDTRSRKRVFEESPPPHPLVYERGTTVKSPFPFPKPRSRKIDILDLRHWTVRTTPRKRFRHNTLK